MKPTVLLDCDGPLSQFTKAYLEVLFLETGARHASEEVDRWAIHETAIFAAAAMRAGVSVGVLKSRVWQRVCAPGFCAAIEPQPEALEAVAALTKRAEVYVVTAPVDASPTWMHERARWVERHFGLPSARVVQTEAKYLVRGDVFVDDKASHVEEWENAWPTATAFLFDMHHNRSEGVGFRRGSWSDVDRALSFFEARG